MGVARIRRRTGGGGAPDAAAPGSGGCRVDELADQFGTPLFVYDEAHLRARCREAHDAFGDGVAYATKAFTEAYGNTGDLFDTSKESSALGEAAARLSARLAADEARAALASADAKLADARLTQKRQAQLFQQGLNSAASLQQADAALAVALANQQVAAEQLAEGAVVQSHGISSCCYGPRCAAARARARSVPAPPGARPIGAIPCARAFACG